MPLSFDELRASRKARTKTVAVPLDEDVLREIDRLERALSVQRAVDETENVPPKAPAMERRLEELRLEAEQASEDFTFQELTTSIFGGTRTRSRRLCLKRAVCRTISRWNSGQRCGTNGRRGLCTRCSRPAMRCVKNRQRSLLGRAVPSRPAAKGRTSVLRAFGYSTFDVPWVGR